MKRVIWIFFLLLSQFSVFSQQNWQWTEIAPLPKPTTENAICEAKVGKDKFVYSFGGIVDSLNIENVQQYVFKYSINLDEWSQTTSIPDSLGKLGHSASFIKNKVYVIGGKYINDDHTENISNKVHVYNPFIDTFEVNGTPIPTGVAYHVQTVWNDSLIYVISGEGNNGAVLNVQIYNPAFDSWSQATELPNEPKYPTYKASGYILKDTIYYFGGVKEDEVSTSSVLRKGVINPDNPTEIEWEIIMDAYLIPQYKGVCSGHDKTLFWFGGTTESFTLDSLQNEDYKLALNRFTTLYNIDGTVSVSENQQHLTNLRSIAKLGGGNWIVTGGLDTLKQIRNNVYLIHNPKLSGADKATQPPFFSVREHQDRFQILTENIGEIVIYDISGRTIYRSPKHLADLWILKSQLQNGLLLFSYDDEINLPVIIKKVLNY